MARIPKDWVEAYYTYGIDKDNRRIFLDGCIDEDSAATLRRSILYLDSQADNKPIELWICSEGGDLYGMFSIYDTLRTVTCPIHTIATGMCMSATPLLVAAGTKGERYATPNSWWMIHQHWVTQGHDARIDEVQKANRHNYALLSRHLDLLSQHSKMSKSQLEKMCKSPGDDYFDANKALEYGLVDHIWSER